MIKFNVPVMYEYYKGRGSKKKKHTRLISWNMFMGLNRYAQSGFKNEYKDMLAKALPKDLKQIEGEYEVVYIYHYKNEKSDMPNVISVLSKNLNDLLQELCIVQEDNVKFLKKEISIVGKKVEEPYVEITIKKKE